MRDATIAATYADALFDLGERHQAHDAYAAALHELVAVIEQEPLQEGRNMSMLLAPVRAKASEADAERSAA